MENVIVECYENPLCALAEAFPNKKDATYASVSEWLAQYGEIVEVSMSPLEAFLANF